jgi:hypothetical protein
MARIADDTMINFAKLEKFVICLERRHNPLTEFIFKAHCVQDKRYNFPQGGSGFLFSRFACEVASRHETTLIRESVWAEDLSMGAYLAKHGFPVQAMAGGFFLGHRINSVHMSRLRMGAQGISQMPSCSSELDHAKGCGEYIAPLNDLIFFHIHAYFSLNEVFSTAEQLFSAPDRVFWWDGTDGYAGFCRQDNLSLIGRASLWDSPRIRWGRQSSY